MIEPANFISFSATRRSLKVSNPKHSTQYDNKCPVRGGKTPGGEDAPAAPMAALARSARRALRIGQRRLPGGDAANTEGDCQANCNDAEFAHRRPHAVRWQTYDDVSQI